MSEDDFGMAPRKREGYITPYDGGNPFKNRRLTLHPPKQSSLPERRTHLIRARLEQEMIYNLYGQWKTIDQFTEGVSVTLNTALEVISRRTELASSPEGFYPPEQS